MATSSRGWYAARNTKQETENHTATQGQHRYGSASLVWASHLQLGTMAWDRFGSQQEEELL
eukprot:136315-Pelagomonas_calceolata.AAC.2